MGSDSPFGAEMIPMDWHRAIPNEGPCCPNFGVVHAGVDARQRVHFPLFDGAGSSSQTGMEAVPKLNDSLMWGGGRGYNGAYLPAKE